MLFQRTIACSHLRNIDACQKKSRGFAYLGALGLVSMMLHYVIVKTVILVGLTGMHKTGCSGETRLALHIPGI